jgi:hypothetical protein
MNKETTKELEYLANLKLDEVLGAATIKVEVYQGCVPYIRAATMIARRYFDIEAPLRNQFINNSFEKYLSETVKLIRQFEKGIKGDIGFDTITAAQLQEHLTTFLSNNNTQQLAIALFFGKNDSKPEYDKIDDILYAASGKLLEIEKIDEKAQKMYVAIAEKAEKATITGKANSFETAAGSYQRVANWWIFGASVAIVLTAVIIFNSDYLFGLNGVKESYELIRKLSSKMIILGILISMIVWMARIYKANRNLSIIYKHKADSLKTFEIFVENAKESQTKDYVLQETTKTIFSIPITGLNDNDSLPIETSSKIFEIIKSTKTP